jgi:16S rRNA (guanine966-N2)-methyltransferase
MRVIGGYFKGKKIIEPSDKNTRPLKDLTKESIFNILKHSNKFSFSFENSNVLDLFSGVGSFGIECLSRGAKHVTFVENYLGVIKILKKNLSNLNQKNNYEIFEDNIFNDQFIKKLNYKFDLIFLDPPYAENKINYILDKINDNSILSEEGIIIMHRPKKNYDQYPNYLNIIEKKKYGINQIIFASLR